MKYSNNCGVSETKYNLLNINNLESDIYIYIYITDNQCFTKSYRLFQRFIMKLCALAHGFCRISWIQRFKNLKFKDLRFNDSAVKKVQNRSKVHKSKSQIKYNQLNY